jgi:hypothetical protein
LYRCACRYARGKATDIHCVCGRAYCFACEQLPHAPMLCSQAKEWKEMSKLASDSNHKSELYEDDAAWLLSFTKPCPRCKNPIQKNQGCDHMTCRVVAGGCGYEFCWVCLASYAGHNASQCNAVVGAERIKKILGEQIEKRGRTQLTKRFEAYVPSVRPSVRPAALLRIDRVVIGREEERVGGGLDTAAAATQNPAHVAILF